MSHIDWQASYTRAHQTCSPALRNHARTTYLLTSTFYFPLVICFFVKPSEDTPEPPSKHHRPGREMAGAEVWWDECRQVCDEDRRGHCCVRSQASLLYHPSELVCRDCIDQHKVAIVCSARSGSTKALGTTNLLLRAAKEALQRTSSPSGSGTPGHMTPALSSRASQTQSPLDSPRARSSSSPRLDPLSPSSALSMSSTSARSPAFNETVDLIRSEHFTAARSSIHNAAILRELELEIEHDCDSLRSFLFATQVIDEISPRSRDTIIGFGERLSCKVMTAILRDRV